MEDEKELEALRQKRLEEARQRQEQRIRSQEMLTTLRRGVLPFLDKRASERLDRLRMVNPMRAAKAESYVAQLARAGRVSPGKKLTEQELLKIIKSIEPPRRETKILRR